MNRMRYLMRIGLAGNQIDPDIEGLKLLQKQHLLSIPFENLDIHWHTPIVLNADSFYSKIVKRGRGGFCYELNGLFMQLLTDIGFTARLVSARVFAGESGFTAEYDHAAVIVTIGDDEYLVDVGFGDFSAGPLRLVMGLEQHDREGAFMIRPSAQPGHVEVVKRLEDGWVPEYAFGPAGRDLAEFADRCDFQQYSPDSHFTKGKLCSVMTAAGRKTLTDSKFIVTADGIKTETPITDENQFYEYLAAEFDILRPGDHK